MRLESLERYFLNLWTRLMIPEHSPISLLIMWSCLPLPLVGKPKIFSCPHGVISLQSPSMFILMFLVIWSSLGWLFNSNFSDVEYCALPQLRFWLRFRLRLRFKFRLRFRFRFSFRWSVTLNFGVDNVRVNINLFMLVLEQMANLRQETGRDG